MKISSLVKFPKSFFWDSEQHQDNQFHILQPELGHQVYYQEVESKVLPFDFHFLHWYNERLKILELLPKKNNSKSTEKDTYSDAHKTMPADSTPLIFAGFKLHNTTTNRSCISS